MDVAAAHSPTELKDFWEEFHDIERNKTTETAEEEELSKTPDEGELEANFLQEAGFGNLAEKFKDGTELSEDEVQMLTATLSSQHAAVIKRRVDTLNATLRKKQKQNKIDVRDIFPVPLEKKGIQLGTSPTGQEFVQPERAQHHTGSHGKDRSPFLRRGAYAMKGTRSENLEIREDGVEMLSVQPKGTFYRGMIDQPDKFSKGAELSPISDIDISFDFSQEEHMLPHDSRQDSRSALSRSKPKDHLPNFALRDDKLGLTRIKDLSRSDILVIRRLALLELTSMFDCHGIMYSRQRQKKKFREQGIFGVPLNILLEQDRKREPKAKVPLVFQEILNYLVKHCLDSEGLLRIPGSVARIKQLRQDLEEKFYQGTFRWGDVTPNDVAAILKQFIRELPIPLLTSEYIEAFTQVERISDKKNQLKALNLLVLLLPDENRDLLKSLLQFLSHVVDHSDQNKMGLVNVGMIMAPNLFMSPTNHPTKSKNIHAVEITMATETSNIMMMLIKYHEILWTIPTAVMALMRRHYEQEQMRKTREKSADFQEGVIRVQAPNLTKSSMAIQLDDKMTAGDIVAKFRQNQTTGDRSHRTERGAYVAIYSDPQKVTYAGDNTCLYEVGGNIGERCLMNNTNMRALYEVNPNAEWIIKQRVS
ncbi:hypothetical protein CHS0354_029508 [Potamilus streckersoni]|uniref:Rho-GAP domain-containing protein n=1 Tax=Potamilus streckersoni TaxID=2493646 RepID=A0AAE0W6J3_9BIVA|nr:hypothetical protein CHS0354_029508 [Potamilus streckersoni]